MVSTNPIASGTEVAFKVVGTSDLYPGTGRTPHLISRIATASNVIVETDDVFPLFVGYNSFAESGFTASPPTVRPILAASPTYKELYNDPRDWKFTYFSVDEAGTQVSSGELPKDEARRCTRYLYLG